MTPYEILKQHLAKHMYKRGANKGDAPLYPERRGKTTHRVIDRVTHMVVRMHYTDIVRAYPDGRVVINCEGWSSSITTRQAVSDALGLMSVPWRMGSVRYRNLSQPVLWNPYTSVSVRYYDGITIDAADTITELKPFRAKVKDTDSTGAFREAIKASGFKDLYPILYTAAEPDHIKQYFRSDTKFTQTILTNRDMSEDWLAVVAAFKWDYGWASNVSANKAWVACTMQETWAKISNTVTKEMNKIIDTDVTHI